MNDGMMGAPSAEARIQELGIMLPEAPKPLGAYVPAVRSGKLLFLSGMLPIVNGEAQAVGRIGAELTLEQGREAARIACLNALAVVRKHIGSLDRVTRVVRLAMAIAVAEDFRDHARLADAASNLLEDVFGKEKTSTRILTGITNLPMGLPLELELIFEVETW